MNIYERLSALYPSPKNAIFKSFKAAALAYQAANIFAVAQTQSLPQIFPLQPVYIRGNALMETIPAQSLREDKALITKPSFHFSEPIPENRRTADTRQIIPYSFRSSEALSYKGLTAAKTDDNNPKKNISSPSKRKARMLWEPPNVKSEFKALPPFYAPRQIIKETSRPAVSPLRLNPGIPVYSAAMKMFDNTAFAYPMQKTGNPLMKNILVEYPSCMQAPVNTAVYGARPDYTIPWPDFGSQINYLINSQTNRQIGLDIVAKKRNSDYANSDSRISRAILNQAETPADKWRCTSESTVFNRKTAFTPVSFPNFYIHELNSANSPIPAKKTNKGESENDKCGSKIQYSNYYPKAAKKALTADTATARSEKNNPKLYTFSPVYIAQYPFFDSETRFLNEVYPFSAENLLFENNAALDSETMLKTKEILPIETNGGEITEDSFKKDETPPLIPRDETKENDKIPYSGHNSQQADLLENIFSALTEAFTETEAISAEGLYD